jgi:hypothetical protein
MVEVDLNVPAYHRGIVLNYIMKYRNDFTILLPEMPLASSETAILFKRVTLKAVFCNSTYEDTFSGVNTQLRQK